ncbi:MAG: 50S ribosomal protein L18 [Bradymonadales bacterium]
MTKKKAALRLRRKRAVRSKLRGSAERPRLSVFRSNKQIYVQLIDDSKGCTLMSLSTLHPSLKPLLEGKKPVEQAKVLGLEAGKLCKEKSITKVAFDRNGFSFHGRVAALAAGAREAGLEF